MNYSGWLSWQIDYLLVLQNFRDVSHHVFDKFFLYITLFGEITIPVIILCFVYWVINKKVGQYLLWCWMIGFIINLFLKASACIYRPWILDSRVHPLAEAIPAATGYSFPSGHTAGVMSIFGGLVVSFWNSKIIRYLSIFIIVSVMVSRNYLGVHTPQDVIVSFLVGCLILWGIYNLLKWIESDKPDGNRDLISVLIIMGVIVLTIMYIMFKPYPIHYLFGKVLYLPCDMQQTALVKSGFAFGSFVGWLTERRCVDFNPQVGSVFKKCLRMIIGVILLYSIYSFTKVLAGLNIPHAGAYTFIEFVILGLFITFIYPLIIKRCNL